MGSPDPPKPSEAELAILQVLWEAGPLTVRGVQERLSEGRDVGYTTVLKLLQIMTTKGLVERDESAKSHVYRARPERQATQRRFVLDVIEKVFGGSGRDLILQALSAKPASAKELDEIRSLLDQLEGGQDGRDAELG